MKVCTKCELNLPLEDFSDHPAMSDGKLPNCKLCHAEITAQRRVTKQEMEEVHAVSTYLDRHRERREQEESLLRETRGAQREDREVLGFGEQVEFDLYRYGASFIRSGKVGRGYRIQ